MKECLQCPSKQPSTIGKTGAAESECTEVHCDDQRASYKDREICYCNKGEFYQPSRSHCELCGAGTYNDDVGRNESCKKCPVGKFAHSRGTTSVTLCRESVSSQLQKCSAS